MDDRSCTHRMFSTKPPKDFSKFTVRAGSDDPNGKMRGWQIHEYGGVELLRCSDNIKIPLVTSPNEVCVEVHTASVNPIDVAMMGTINLSCFFVTYHRHLLLLIILYNCRWIWCDSLECAAL